MVVWSKGMSKRIFITGGTGFIGSALVAQLRARGDDVIVLTRDPERAAGKFDAEVELVRGDPNRAGPWQAQLAGVDAVVHLVGEAMDSQRWDAQFKQRLRDSRVETTRYVVEGIAALAPDVRPRALVSASGVDYYPAADRFSDGDEVTERDPPGDRFLARLCVNWEREAAAAEAHGARVVRMRTGLVLGAGGALDKMSLPFKLFAGGPIGSGRQWISWLHVDDATRAYVHAIDDDKLAGPVNLVAPVAVRAKEFARALGNALGRPSWLPVPGVALKVTLGEFADYILHGRRAVPAALLAHGFQFSYPELQSALAEVFGGEQR